jgi:hypothetical protein
MEAPLFTVARLAFEKPACHDAQTGEERLKAAEAQSRKIDGRIREETGLEDGTAITYLIGNELFEPERGFTVVIPSNRESQEAFVLCKEAYLMTDNGKTIERIV